MTPSLGNQAEQRTALAMVPKASAVRNQIVITLTKAVRTFIRLVREYESEGNPTEAERLRDIARWHIGRRRREMEQQS